MVGTSKFIIQLDEIYSEKFKTESGLELYGVVDFTTERQLNRIVKIVGIPALLESEIKEGYEILIDGSDFYRQIYNGVKQYYQNIVDKDKNWFHLDPSLIICYRKNADSDWIGFGENCLVKPILEGKEINTTLIVPGTVSNKKFTGKVTMTYANKELNQLGVENGDVLHIDKRGGVNYWLDGLEFWWIRTKDIFAIQLN